MNKCFRVLLLCMLSLLQPLMSQDFDEMFVFGTSFFNLGDTPPLINPGGELWEEYLAETLRVSVSDFSDINNTTAQTLTSVQQYLAGHPKINDQQLYIVYTGFVDLLAPLMGGGGGPPDITPAIISTAANNNIQSVQTLQLAGTTYIILPNQANYSLCPGVLSSPEIIPLVNDAIQSLNDQTTALASVLDVNVIQMDFFGLTDEIVANPLGFGFINVTDPAQEGGDPDKYLWWDIANFTGAGNRVFSDYALSVLQGPECFAALSELPLNVLQVQNLNIFQQLAPLRLSRVWGCPSFFIAGDYAPIMTGEFCDDHNHSWNWNTTVGVLSDWDDLTFGLAYGYAKTESGWHHSDGEFHVKSNTVSLFGSFHPYDGYINVIGNYTWLDFSVHRKFNLGLKPVDAMGSPSGQQYGIAINTAYYAGESSLWRVGPILNLEYQRIEIDRYQEHGAGSANLFYGFAERNSFITAIGWQFVGGYSTDTRFNFYAAYNRDWIKNDKTVHFGILSLENVTSFKIESHYANFASFGLGLNHTFADQLEGEFSYQARIGSPNLNTHAFTLGLSYQL